MYNSKIVNQCEFTHKMSLEIKTSKLETKNSINNLELLYYQMLSFYIACEHSVFLNFNNLNLIESKSFSICSIVSSSTAEEITSRIR